MLMVGSSPEAYEVWLAGIVEQTRAHYRDDQRIVFINAWNEWAEGCHLEPDRRYAYKYLEATRRALATAVAGPALSAHAKAR
jgi:hypothetical protein